VTSKIIEAACQIAFEAHQGEFRKGPKAHHNAIPYFIHSADVLKRVVNWGIYCPITLCKCVLHDVEESRPGEEFLAKFKKLSPPDSHVIVDPIIQGVEEELTYIPSSQWKGSIPKKKWEDKEAYLASFMTASTSSLLVKVSDRICNVWDFVHAGNEYAKKYFQAADALFEAMILRKDDLTKHYTIRPIEAMMIDYEYLRAGVMG